MFQVTYIHTWRDIKFKKKKKRKKKRYTFSYFSWKKISGSTLQRPHRRQIPVHALPVLPALNSRHAARSVRTTRK
jgi:hypothetical protein